MPKMLLVMILRSFTLVQEQSVRYKTISETPTLGIGDKGKNN